ncbi:MAG: hypothetical protein LBU66_03160 [Treponema sp.]|jgi:hypothetical protein|nr:hypothetical protein [Treponema sp.]
MKIIADLSKGKLILNDYVRFEITCRVRTVKNGDRKKSEVICTIPQGYPYDPMTFPKGSWKVTGVEWQKDYKFDYSVYGPVKIRTDAWQWAKIWELDEKGCYLKERGDEIQDYGYLLHYSTSSTTLGCIRIASPQDAESIARLIEDSLKRGETADLEVM